VASHRCTLGFELVIRGRTYDLFIKDLTWAHTLSKRKENEDASTKSQLLFTEPACHSLAQICLCFKLLKQACYWLGILWDEAQKVVEFIETAGPSVPIKHSTMSFLGNYFNEMSAEGVVHAFKLKVFMKA
jgi:hypothetical protein